MTYPACGLLQVMGFERDSSRYLSRLSQSVLGMGLSGRPLEYKFQAKLDLPGGGRGGSNDTGRRADSPV